MESPYAHVNNLTLLRLDFREAYVAEEWSIIPAVLYGNNVIW